MVGKELWYIAQAHHQGHLAGGGHFTKHCQKWLQNMTGAHLARLTHSCTAALEMSSLLARIGPGDEVILPSYTFVSTANAFVLRGAIPVFIDIREDTLNIDENLIEQAITPRTRAIVPVHYAGISCEMECIMDIARHHDILVIEDAAQGLMSSYKGRALGSIGHLGALSFHETKNIISGEGGALLVNDASMKEATDIAWEKGTNRSRFFQGLEDKYTWIDMGSSFLPSELIAAFLHAQMEEAVSITNARLKMWDTYHSGFSALEAKGMLRRPVVPADCKHNAHMYYLLLSDLQARDHFIARMAEAGIQTVFHYVPLHSSPAGKKFGRTTDDLPITDDIAQRLVRLPLWLGLEKQQGRVIATALDILEHAS